MQTIVRLVPSGLEVAPIPASLRHPGRTGAVYRRPGESRPSAEIALAWRTADTRPAVRRFVAAVRDAVAERTGPG